MSLSLDNSTLLLVAGTLYLLLPLSIWLILRMPRERAPLIWCVGGMLGGMGVLLMGARGQIHDLRSYRARLVLVVDWVGNIGLCSGLSAFAAVRLSAHDWGGDSFGQFGGFGAFDLGRLAGGSI